MQLATEFAAMQAIAARLWSAASWWHPGGMAWQLATERSGAARRIRVWDDGWSWSYPGVLMLQVDAAHAELAREVVAWFEDVNAGDAPRVEVADGEVHVIAALRAAGYTEMPAEPYGLDQRAPAERTPVALPPGYALRHAGEVSADLRVEAHRRSWLPAALPYEPAHQPKLAPDATSDFDAAKLARVQQMNPYAAERDFLITSDAGEPAACCTVWFDATTGSAEIEPLGVVPEHRRRGLAQALCHAAMDAVAAAGGREVVIHPRGDAAYPAPRAAYAAAGFRTVNRTRTYGRN